MGLFAANPKPFCPVCNHWLEQSKTLTVSTEQRSSAITEHLLTCFVGTDAMSCMHCFPQCIRPIHSAHKKEPQPYTPPVARRNSGVRRQSAARGSCSSKQPPLAASLPAKDKGSVQRRFRRCTQPNVPSPDGVSDAQAPQSPSALSFLLIGSSLPSYRRRVATALPRMTD
jgi:hypothetical protein